MNRSQTNYFRNERARLAERLTDVQQEIAINNARRIELEREQSLLTDLLASLDAHVPGEAVTASTDFKRIKGGQAA